ncbi:Papain_family cysteine protease [Hexamita inflata]|uniref:Papain_family cysteine protease n=1 Tax=Hexamita inflata TaxID=28002 RepID=A0ABP1GZN6_9EUKA
MLCLAISFEAIKTKRSFDTISIDSKCKAAFDAFMVQYNKSYTKQEEKVANENFCINFEKLKEFRLQNLSHEVGINEHFDMIRYPNNMIPSPKPPKEEIASNLNKLEAETAGVDDNYSKDGQEFDNYNRYKPGSLTNPAKCSSGNMYIKDDSAILPDSFPNSVDLREWGLIGKALDQGSCGSCYAFSARYVINSAFLHDMYYYEKIYQTAKGLNTSSTRLSVQMILNNSDVYNSYCGGGNFVYAAIDVGYGYTGSMDYESKVPYLSMFQSDSDIQEKPTKINPVTKEFTELDKELNPIHWFNAKTACPSMIIRVNAANDTKGWDTEEQNKIKKMLAMGIPVSGQMNTEAGSSSTQLSFQMYKSGLAPQADCGQATSNHQVTIAGYGHYKGTPVWLFLNSWGSSWGQGGYYMVEMGSNTFCSEVEANTIVPKYWGFDKGYWPTTLAFNESDHYKDSVKNGTFFNMFNVSVRRGANGLDNYDDNDDPIIEYHTLPWSKWILVGVIGVFMLVFLYALYKCICKPPAQKIPTPAYIKFYEKEAAAVKWETADGIDIISDRV